MESSTAQFLLRQSACVQLPMIDIIIVPTHSGIPTLTGVPSFCYCVGKKIRFLFLLGEFFSEGGGLAEVFVQHAWKYCTTVAICSTWAANLDECGWRPWQWVTSCRLTNCELKLSTHAAILLWE